MLYSFYTASGNGFEAFVTKGFPQPHDAKTGAEALLGVGT